ncbi:MAG: hypothetical protein J6A16_05690 [Oscillospiraceae bacterium]|nr:hypothetical protein [Oscillospiraceae bacterium]
MSRSYKRFAVCKDRNKNSKTVSNRIVRRKGSIVSGKSNAYRKLYCSYNICDYRFVETKKQVISEYEQDMKATANGQQKGVVSYKWKKKMTSLDDRINFWAKYYYRK